MDALKPAPGASRICVFINDHFVDFHDDLVDGIYTYYLAKHEAKLKLITEDKARRFRLYELPIH